MRTNNGPLLKIQWANITIFSKHTTGLLLHTVIIFRFKTMG